MAFYLITFYVIIIIYQSMIIYFLCDGNGLPSPRHDMQGKKMFYIEATS